MNNQTQYILNKIEKWEQIAPFLFVWTNIEQLSVEIFEIIRQIYTHLWVPKQEFHSLSLSQETIKILDVRKFLEKTYQKPGHACQVFIIEDISRLTLSSSNALLKFLEEPWVWNIVFLTSKSKSNILETLLSRVQVVEHISQSKPQSNDAIVHMIHEYARENNPRLLEYYFSQNLEKADAHTFLYSLYEYIEKSSQKTQFLENIEQDLKWLKNNNFTPKFIVDSYITRL